MYKYIEALLHSYESEGGINQIETVNLPSQDDVERLLTIIKSLLFPGYFVEGPLSNQNLRERTTELVLSLKSTLTQEINKSFNVFLDNNLSDDHISSKSDSIVDGFIAELPQIRHKLKQDRHAIFSGDPAAQSDAEILLAYPGFHAIMVFRIATFFYYQGVPLIPRIMAELAHSDTGIEINPGAKIGSHFCIDHGTGVVIGETTVIGDYVKLYQGVTLGALSVKDRNLKGQRHPTIEDHVTIYSGTTILGGDTCIGHHSIIGGNVWLTKSVSPNSKVYIQSDQKKSQIEKEGS